MSLDAALAHARKMATAQHKPDCPSQQPARFNWPRPGAGQPPPACPGCVSDADRALWAQLADEYAAQIERNREETLL